MKFVFVHQNFPGQFGRIASALIKDGHEVVGIGTLKQCTVPGVKYFSYVPVDGPDDEPSTTAIRQSSRVCAGPMGQLTARASSPSRASVPTWWW